MGVLTMDIECVTKQNAFFVLGNNLLTKRARLFHETYALYTWVYVGGENSLAKDATVLK